MYMEQQNQKALLLFEIGKKKFFLEINQLEEIIPYQSITRLPMSSKNIKGITNFRGEIIGVFDLIELLSLPEKNDRNTRIIVVKDTNNKFGILASRVFEVAYMPLTDIIFNASGFIKGVANYKKEEIGIINIKKIIEAG